MNWWAIAMAGVLGYANAMLTMERGKGSVLVVILIVILLAFGFNPIKPQM